MIGKNDNDPDHVGIVVSSVDGYINTVEGNGSDECKQRNIQQIIMSFMDMVLTKKCNAFYITFYIDLDY